MTALTQATQRLRVLVVDDHEVVQWGFRLMLGSQPWVERCLGASTGPAAYELAARYEPHVAVIDLFVGAEAGPDISRTLTNSSPRTRVLLISGAGHISPDSVRAAGAHGFIPKGLAAGDVAQAVRMVALGASVFQTTDREQQTQLSSREREVLALVAHGETNRQIAATLHLSPHTVKGHTSSLYRKLDAKNRAEAVQRAQRLGLVN
jgi:DNA-binding NarL/FixJ family response regulator